VVEHLAVRLKAFSGMAHLVVRERFRPLPGGALQVQVLGELLQVNVHNNRLTVDDVTGCVVCDPWAR